ncbi:MAG: cation:proton antiporter [Spirochaetota bacterium]
MHGTELTHQLALLLLQIGALLIVARFAGIVAKRIGLPTLLGEVITGVVLGPYALGSLSFPGFEHGFFPLATGILPISIELYAFAAVGAVVHIFLVGLETDIRSLARLKAVAVRPAIGGIIVPGLVGAAFPVLVLGYELGNPVVLFFAGISISTSLGVQARILSDYHKLDTPEGRVIMESSLLQDGLAITILAITMAILSFEGDSGAAGLFAGAVPIFVQALLVWIIGFSLVIGFAPQIANLLKRLGAPAAVAAIPALALALLFSGSFELAGIASIIGAYGVGAALSRTDVVDLVQERMRPVADFFVPLLYAILGMFIDVSVILTPHVLFAGLLFALVSGLAKVVGSGIPAMRVGFNLTGALRIGVGTVSRGEVALIMGLVGDASGLISSERFDIIAIMTITSILVGSPLFSALTKHAGTGRSDTDTEVQPAVVSLDVPNEEIADLVRAGLLRLFTADGYIVHRLELDKVLYRVRRDNVMFTFTLKGTCIELSGDSRDEGMLRTALYETLVHVSERVSRMAEMTVPEELRRGAAEAKGRDSIRIGDYLSPQQVSIPLHAESPEEVIHELAALLPADAVLDQEMVAADVIRREQQTGTGMEHGLAIPHAKTDGVSRMVCAVGIIPDGIDFQAVDQKPSNIVVLIASPKNSKGPHLQFLAALVQRLRQENAREAILASRTPDEVVQAFSSTDAVNRGSGPFRVRPNRR